MKMLDIGWSFYLLTFWSLLRKSLFSWRVLVTPTFSVIFKRFIMSLSLSEIKLFDLLTEVMPIVPLLSCGRYKVCKNSWFWDILTGFIWDASFFSVGV